MKVSIYSREEIEKLISKGFPEKNSGHQLLRPAEYSNRGDFGTGRL